VDEPRRIEGVIPVLPVPFAEDEAVDLEAFAAEVDWVARRPVDGLALFGLASEYWKLSAEERIALCETLVATVARRKPVLVSVTDACAYHARRFAARAVSIGADGLIVMPPHFMAPGLERIVDHCRAVADAAAPAPVVVQYSPAYIGNAIPAEVFVRMHERSPNIRYVKVEPRPPGPMIDAIRAASGGRIGCLIGHGGLSLADCRRRGIAGLMPGVSVVEIYRRLWDGLGADPVDAQTLDLHDRMVAMMAHTVPTIDAWVAAEKRVLAWRGVIDRPVMRAPSSDPEPAFFGYLHCCYERILPYLDQKEP